MIKKYLFSVIFFFLMLGLLPVYALDAEVHLLPGNLLTLSLMGNDAISADYRIDPRGFIQLPEIGPINCKGHTLKSFQEFAAKQLTSMYKNADSLTVSLKDAQIYVKVLGLVAKPGVYLIGRYDGIQLAIEKAGGMLDGAQMNQLQLHREANVTIVDYKQYLSTGSSLMLPSLMAMDEIFVPSSKLMGNVKLNNQFLLTQQGDAPNRKEAIKIFGAVFKPGAYSYHTSFSVVDYLLKAGGTTQYAQTDQIRVIDNTTAQSFNLREYLNTARKDLLPKISLGATIFVPQIGEVAKTGSGTVYVMGQVQRPGSYDISKQTSFMDAIGNAGGPNQYAEARKIRIIKSDGTVEYFDMQSFTEGLVKNLKLPTLAGGDVIYFPLKTDLNEKSWLDIAPNRSIKIIGAVARPGRYEWSDEMNILDLISTVGGPTKEADTSHIRIVSNDAGKLPVEFNLKNVIEMGIGKDKLPKLNAGDTVIVAEIARAPLDMQRAVKMFGEVNKPGSFAYNPKLSIMDYISLAGGITHYAGSEQIKVLDNERSILFNLKEYVDTGKTKDLPGINPGATIFIPVETTQTKSNSRTVYVMGQVQKPGAYELGKNGKFMDVIASSGGPNQYAETRKVRIISVDQKVAYFDLLAFTEGIRKIALPEIKTGDVIYFPLKTNLNEKSWLDIAPKRAIKVMGSVNQPGRYEWADEMSILDILANVGGPTKGGDMAHIKIIPNDNSVAPFEFNLKKAIENGVGKEGLPILKGGYTIFVPEEIRMPSNMQKSIKVFGEVFKPGPYAFNPNYTAIDYILLAGGTTHYAAPDQIRVIDNDTSIMFNLKDYLDTANTSKMPKISKGATIFVPVGVPSSEVKSDARVVYVMGQVQKPGSYELGKKATFLDALANAGGPNQYAEMRKIRLIHKVGPIEYFDMQAFTEGLSTAKLPQIASDDVIYIPIKTDLNEKSWLQVAPNHAVKVIGAVTKPGRYEWSDEMSLIDALAHAGGPTNDADIANIRVVTNEHDKMGKITTVKFNLNKFVEHGGDLSIVPVVKAGYTIEVPVLPRSPIDNKAIWTEQDPKSTIYVFGEVGKPGRYNFNDHLNFLDILSAADGPTEKADLHDVHVIDRQGVYSKVIHVNLSLYFETGDPELIPKVLPGDAIYLPQRNKDYTETNTKHVIKVLGEVKNPGRYRYASNMTVLDVLAAAGGPTQQALVTKILVVNMGTKLETQSTTFDLLEFSKTGNLSMLPTLREGDVIYVPNNDEDFRKQFATTLQNLANAAIIVSSLGGLNFFGANSNNTNNNNGTR